MKTFYFNIQAKGGAGKSMLTYLQALKNEGNDNVAFVDLDNSTKTSIKQLKFLDGTDRLINSSIIDSLRRVEREKLFGVLEGINKGPWTEYYLDFGAPESEQLPSLFNMDFSAEEFKEFENSIDAQFVFNIVISGGPAYKSCMEYAHIVVKALKGLFTVYLYVNEFSFQNYPGLVKEVETYVSQKKDLVNGFKVFGNISVDRQSGQNILEFVKEGKGFNDYTGFATKTIMKRELQKV